MMLKQHPQQQPHPSQRPLQSQTLAATMASLSLRELFNARRKYTEQFFEAIRKPAPSALAQQKEGDKESGICHLSLSYARPFIRQQLVTK